ncbi:MAG TPA: hypothetical protein VGM14_26935 [Streptosporangiaceae bacterium]|jgi:hypothetical protein
MTDFDDRLARVLHDAVPAPPHELEPSAIRASASRHERRKHRLAPAIAAVAVAAVAIGVPLAVHQLGAPQRRSSSPRAVTAPRPVPSPPAGFTANEFRMAPSGVIVMGGPPVRRAACTLKQISATAATRRTGGGVLGVIRLVGAVISRQAGLAERCTLPIVRGPTALTGPDGRVLKVARSGGDPTSRPANPRPDIAVNNGNAIWGFAWLGSYCGAPASAIEIPLDQAGEASPHVSLLVPLHGPQPACEPAGGASTLIDGVAGAPGEPVQPARPEYSSLRLTGQIKPGTTSGQLAPIDLTLRTIGRVPVTLDPCPAYAGRDDATARSGGFGDPIRSGYLPCTRRAVVIRPGHPLRWTIPATSLLQTPGTGAIPGSTVYVQLGIAGVLPLRLKTSAGR